MKKKRTYSVAYFLVKLMVITYNEYKSLKRVFIFRSSPDYYARTHWLPYILHSAASLIEHNLHILIVCLVYSVRRT